MRKYLSALLVLVLGLSFTLVPAGPAAAATINVAADATALQNAINSASAGDTINVAAGSFSANITVNKQVTIKGAGSSGSTNTTVIAAQSGQPVFNITASGARIQDFVITRTGGRSYYGVRIGASSVTVRSSLITGHSTGVYIDRTADNRVYRNTITGNDIGVYLPGITGSNSVTYNDIVGNTQGANAGATPSDPNKKQGAAWNWWGNASGPGGSGPGTGDSIGSHVSVWGPWLNRDSATTLADGVADVSIAVPLRAGWNSLSARFTLTADSNNWNEIVTRSNLTYETAYMYDADTGWTQLTTTSTTVIEPLNAVLIKMSSSATVVMKVATFPSSPPTRALKRGWNLIGAAPAFDKNELEMWKVLASVANTSTGQVGYDMVVSPSLQGQSSWVYVRGEEAETDFTWQKMDAGRGYWIYMENPDDLAGFSATPIAGRTYD